MNSPQQPSSDASLIIEELEKLGMQEPALNDLVSEMHAGLPKSAAEKLQRLWNWPSVLGSFLFAWKLDSTTYIALQAIYVDSGFSDEFFVALDKAISASNLYLPPDERKQISYQSLSERFHQVLQAVLRKFPDIELSDSQIAEFELDYLSSNNHDEEILREALTRRLQTREPQP